MNALAKDLELAAYKAFLSLPPSRLPIPPFHLTPWIRVNDPVWFTLLRNEVLAACEYLEGRQEQPQPRQRTGALLAVLRNLKPLLHDPTHHPRTAKVTHQESPHHQTTAC